MEFFQILGTFQGWTYLLILTLLEIVLGIDNIIFISIVTDNLPPEQKKKARNTGLALALIVRLFLLGIVSVIIGMTTPLITVFGFGISVQSLVLLIGGLFLIYKSTIEMHKSVKGHESSDQNKTKTTMSGIITQIIFVDLIFSFDSVITAIGMTNGIRVETGFDPLVIIYVSVIVSMIVMFLFSGQISSFISNNPTIKMIALSFLVTIGVLLIAEAFHQKIPKTYVYFAFVYSLVVEFLNIRMRRNSRNESN
ncbi:MAG: TerC family protein [Bacteroidetes bacterium]|nr:TerC family protein [Bacteroidota bacterium]